MTIKYCLVKNTKSILKGKEEHFLEISWITWYLNGSLQQWYMRSYLNFHPYHFTSLFMIKDMVGKEIKKLQSPPNSILSKRKFFFKSFNISYKQWIYVISPSNKSFSLKRSFLYSIFINSFDLKIEFLSS